MAIASDMVKLPTHHVWLDYDKEADVLYMSFRKPQRATKTIETDEDILIRKDGTEIVGLTIMNASSNSIRGYVLWELSKKIENNPAMAARRESQFRIRYDKLAAQIT